MNMTLAHLCVHTRVGSPQDRVPHSLAPLYPQSCCPLAIRHHPRLLLFLALPGTGGIPSPHRAGSWEHPHPGPGRPALASSCVYIPIALWALGLPAPVYFLCQRMCLPLGAGTSSRSGPLAWTCQPGNLIRRWNRAAVTECVIYLNGTKCDTLLLRPRPIPGGPHLTQIEISRFTDIANENSP